MDFDSLFSLLAALDKINWLAVIVAALICFMLAALWYCSWFARPWRRAHGIPVNNSRSDAEHTVRRLGLILLGYFVMALVVAVLLNALGINTLRNGALIGMLLGVGLGMADSLVENQLQNRPAIGFFLDAGFRILSLSVLGAIIAGWQ